MFTFRALTVQRTDQSLDVSVGRLSSDSLPPGGVLIRVHYSSVNFKDGLALLPDGRTVKTYPMVPGIDLSGIVVSSDDPLFHKGDQVIATSYELGVSHFGGFSEYARVPADWIVPLPEGMSLNEAMIYGTAGLTAAISIQRMEENGAAPRNGPILVTGATGGVGSMAVAMLHKRGYEVAASTGKTSEHDYLRRLGADHILTREEVSPERLHPLSHQQWAGAVDPVGGKTLSYILSSTRSGGVVAVSGLTGGSDLHTTVFPFILRGISLLGISSVDYPLEQRKQIWQRLSVDLKPTQLSEMVAREISLDQVSEACSEILQGKVRGRIIVKL